MYSHMKKLFILFTAFVLVGAGCLGTGSKQSQDVEGRWSLAFDLPDGWYMMRPYTTDQGASTQSLIERLDPEVYLQDTEKTIWRGNRAPQPEDITRLQEVVTDQDSYILIAASHLDSRRAIPSEAVLLANGLKALDPCATNADCGVDAPKMQYWLETNGDKYQFNVFMTPDRLSKEAEAIITTAKAVTAPVAE